ADIAEVLLGVGQNTAGFLHFQPSDTPAGKHETEISDSAANAFSLHLHGVLDVPVRLIRDREVVDVLPRGIGEIVQKPDLDFMFRRIEDTASAVARLARLPPPPTRRGGHHSGAHATTPSPV